MCHELAPKTHAGAITFECLVPNDTCHEVLNFLG